MDHSYNSIILFLYKGKKCGRRVLLPHTILNCFFVKTYLTD